MTVSRKDIRNALATLLQAGVPAASSIVAYQTEPAGVSPFVCVVGAGTWRRSFTARGLQLTVNMGVHVYVLHVDPASGWTEEMAEDALDQVEYEVGTVLEGNQRTNYWQSIEYEMPSTITKLPISGVPYLYEVIPLTMEVFR